MTMLNWSAVPEPTGGVRVSAVGVNGPAETIFPNANIQQMAQGLERYEAGALVQNAFGFLLSDEREFLMTGLTPEAWDELFSGDEEGGEDLEPEALCEACDEHPTHEGSDYCIFCLAEQAAEDKANRECPLCGREGCSGYCQEFPTR